MKPADLIYREAAPPARPPSSIAPRPASRRPGPGRRSSARSATGLAISIGLHLALAAGFWVTARQAPRLLAPAPAPMAVALERASPPSPPQDVAPGPRRVERQAAKPSPTPPAPLKTTPPADQPVFVAPHAPSRPSDPGPAAPETSAPPVLPAPPASQAASDVKVTWEGQVLERLEKYRRFPDSARARRRQGVVFVRFRLDRPGRLLWSRVERSSGSGELDRAALDTLRRAQPLPAIPADRPQEVELVVPVEFFIAPRG